MMRLLTDDQRLHALPTIRFKTFREMSPYGGNGILVLPEIFIRPLHAQKKNSLLLIAIHIYGDSFHVESPF